MDDPDHDRQEIVDLISFDTAISGLILRIVNSSYYAFPSQINRISTAVGIIGERQLANILLATSMVNGTSHLDQLGINIDAFWMHSLQCGIASRYIGKNLKCNDADNLFLCGVLHDIGKLALYQNFPDLAKNVSSESGESGKSCHEVEGKRFGFDHADVGRILLSEWQLPSLLIEVVGGHHEPEKSSEYRFETDIVALGNAIVDAAEDRSPEEIQEDGFITELCGRLDFPTDEISESLDIAQLQSEEILSLISN